MPDHGPTHKIGAMSTTATSYLHLAANPRSASKQLFVQGTRIRARVLYGWYACADPMSVEEIAAEYSIPVEAVREAIAYCQSDPPELAEDYAREAALMEATGMNQPDYKCQPRPRLLAPQDRLDLRSS